jgi:protein SCO1/2
VTAPVTAEGAAPARTRRRTRVLLVSGVVVGLAVAAVVVGRLSAPPPKPPQPPIGTQLDSALPADIANLPLTDEYGKPTNLAAFKGKVVVLTDFMTLCQEQCPITSEAMNEVDKSVERAGLGNRVEFVEISIDPQRDTPAQLHAYRTFAKLEPNFSLLTGSAADLAKLWKFMGVTVQKVPEGTPPATNWRTGETLTYDLDHSDALFYLDAAGNERYAIYGMPNGSGLQLTQGESSFLDDQGRQNLADTADAAWTKTQALQLVGWLTKHRLKLAS